MENQTELFTNPEAFREQLQKVGMENNVSTDNNIENTTETQHEQQDAPAENAAPQDSGSENEETEVEEVQAETNQPKEDSYKVPKSRLNQEIEKRRALEEQLMKEREDRIRYETQLQMLSKMQQNQPQNEPETSKLPDLDHIDPLDREAHLAYLKEINELKNMVKQNSQILENQQYINIINAQKEHFQKEHPDYNQAAEHFKKVQYDIALDMFGDPAAAEQYVINALETMVRQSVKNGKNVADVIYSASKKSGYQPVSNTSEKPKNGVNLNAINENMKKNVSISGLGNSANLGGNTFDIKHMKSNPKDPYSKVNADKFQEMLRKVAS